MAEPFITTVIGSMPKPPWLYQKPPADAMKTGLQGGDADWLLSGEALTEAQNDAVRLAVFDQEAAGVLIISDGEQRRVSFITGITSQMDGFD